jgi:hypothetical protein
MNARAHWFDYAVTPAVCELLATLTTCARCPPAPAKRRSVVRRQAAEPAVSGHYS